jgi:diguanylate cyclase (GGDEF)-like protein
VANILLSEDKRNYLSLKKEIKMCVDPDWEPFEIIDKDLKHVGISADLIALISSRLNIPIVLVPTKTWEESIEYSKQHKCDILSFLNQTPKRDEWLIFTEPIFKDPNVLIGRIENSYVEDISKVKASIALPKQTAMSERFQNDFPNLTIIPVDSEKEAFDLVEAKKADLTLRSMIITAYTIKKEGLFNLKIIGQPKGYENILRIGVRKDEPILRDILNMGVATITQKDTDGIVNKHVSIVIEEVTYITPSMWSMIGMTILVIVLLFVVFYYKKHFVKSSEEANTDRLTGLFNRHKFELDFKNFFSNANTKEKTSLILFDIDFFKKINDTYGHDVGDKVLKLIAIVVKKSLRENDLLYRWGGEEFIVLLQNNNIEHIRLLAEKIRMNIANTKFEQVGDITCSFGIAKFEDGDDEQTIFKKVDNNLYTAKHNGKNIVVG